MASQGGQVVGCFWPDIRPVLGRIYALFLAKIYAQKAFLENTAFSTGRIFLGVYYRAYSFMDLRSGVPRSAVLGVPQSATKGGNCPKKKYK
jgi:hypothetical protein